MPVSARLTLETDATTRTRARHMDARIPLRPAPASGEGCVSAHLAAPCFEGWIPWCRTMRSATFQSADDALSSAGRSARPSERHAARSTVRLCRSGCSVRSSSSRRRARRVPLAGSKMRGLVAILALDAGSTDRVPAPHRGVVGRAGREGSERGAGGRVEAAPSAGRRRRGRPDHHSSGGLPAPTSTATMSTRCGSRRSLDQARRAGDDPTRGRRAARTRALELWRGTALADAPDTDVDRRASGLGWTSCARVAVEDLVDAELALGRHRRLAPELEALVAAEPLRERRWGQLIRALYGSGQQADALRAFQTGARRAGRDRWASSRAPSCAGSRRQFWPRTSRCSACPAPADVRRRPIGDGFRRRGNVRYPVGRVHRACATTSTCSCGLVERHRLVTLTGPGGVGKTRLALELSVAMKDDVPDGVWWVELAAARSEADAAGRAAAVAALDRPAPPSREAALAAVATVLARSGGGARARQLRAPPRVRSTPVVEELLGRCGRIRIVATSREALGVPAEVLFAVGPLDTVRPRSRCSRRASTGVVDHDAGSADAILQICERLDRLPLALELAAARTRHLRLDGDPRAPDRPLRPAARRVANGAGAPAQPPRRRRLELRPARRTGAARVRAPLGVRRRRNPRRGEQRVLRRTASRPSMSSVCSTG